MIERSTDLPTIMTTAADALHDEEVIGTRKFLRLGLLIAIGVVPMILIVPGNPRIAKVLLAVLGVTWLGSLWMYRRLAPPAKFDARLLNPIALGAIAVGVIGILYVGVFSAAPVMVSLGLFFFCRSESFASALGACVLAIASHSLICALVISGTIEDPGFYPVRAGVPTEALIATAFTMQQLYALCFVLARLTRKSSLRAIDQLQKATRLAAVRDAQVAELQMDLDRALKIGGPGRFSGHVIGSWELGNVLGRGAMGEVYDAMHVKTGAQAAVKMLRRELLADAKHVERFFREVRIAATIDSPNVVKVLEASSSTDQIPFLAMELLRGHTLGEILRTGELTGSKLAAMVTQIGSVLDLARTAGIVHRDLKPHNLFLTDEGVWKVLDFGVAILADNSGTLTGGAVIGTPAYMAPEQAKGQPVDHRADVYGLGAVIYRCLTGRIPFIAKDTPALLYAVVHMMPLRPTAFGPISPEVDAFLTIALAKDRNLRFQTTAQLAESYALADRAMFPPALTSRARSLALAHPWTEPDVPAEKPRKS
ncbi:MAG: serine/threonine protein kinase [Deltaproteobacteria bacterium]|nr:serine/threonine protein kinase [Deltaproteobacteria bacterium]